MRGIIKRLLTAAAALFGVGLLLALAGWLMGGQTSMTVAIGGRDVNIGISGITVSRWGGAGNLLSANRVTAEEELEPFTALDIGLALGDVHLVPSDHYGVALSWEGEDCALHYTNDNGTLTVWNKSAVQLGVGLDAGHGAEVRVYIPEHAALDTVTVKTSLGSVELTGLRARRLDLVADLGDVAVADAQMDAGVMVLDLGSLKLNQVAARTLDLTLSLGKAEGRDLTVTQALTAECDMGKAELAGTLKGRTEIVSHMGDVKLTVAGSGDDYGYDLSTSMGKVTVDGRKSGDEAKGRGGPHTIEVRNSMGDIELKFSNR